MKNFCAYCGTENPAQPCRQCGRTGTTETSPSQEPCAYCGARPTWAVVYEMPGRTEAVYLCAECDEQEIKELDH